MKNNREQPACRREVAIPALRSASSSQGPANQTSRRVLVPPHHAAHLCSSAIWVQDTSCPGWWDAPLTQGSRRRFDVAAPGSLPKQNLSSGDVSQDKSGALPFECTAASGVQQRTDAGTCRRFHPPPPAARLVSLLYFTCRNSRYF